MYSSVLISTKSSQLKLPTADFRHVPLPVRLIQGGTLQVASRFVGSCSADRGGISKRGGSGVESWR